MFYSEEQIQKLNQDNKKYLIISLVILGVVIAGFITTLFFLNDDIIRVIQIVMSIALSLTVCFLIYVILNIVLPNNRRRKFIDNILRREEVIYDCSILDIGKVRTINHNIKVYDVSIVYKGRIVTVFLDDEYKNRINELEGLLTLKIRDKYIVEIIK